MNNLTALKYGTKPHLSIILDSFNESKVLISSTFSPHHIISYREVVNYPLGRSDGSECGEGGVGRRRYLEVLLDQVQSKMVGQLEKRKVDDEKMAAHFQQFDGYWGRPGYGAPMEGKGSQKENLMKILHYPSQKVKSLHIVQCASLCSPYHIMYTFNKQGQKPKILIRKST